MTCVATCAPAGRGIRWLSPSRAGCGWVDYPQARGGVGLAKLKAPWIGARRHHSSPPILFTRHWRRRSHHSAYCAPLRRSTHRGSNGPPHLSAQAFSQLAIVRGPLDRRCRVADHRSQPRAALHHPLIRRGRSRTSAVCEAVVSVSPSSFGVSRFSSFTRDSDSGPWPTAGPLAVLRCLPPNLSAATASWLCDACHRREQDGPRLRAEPPNWCPPERGGFAEKHGCEALRGESSSSWAYR